ncbi:hypothetical protein [Leptolyngbya ohadii]|nr:hypothetical protein [Leptolyngbya ohadii]
MKAAFRKMNGVVSTSVGRIAG